MTIMFLITINYNKNQYQISNLRIDCVVNIHFVKNISHHYSNHRYQLIFFRVFIKINTNAQS